jgi:hypothetical protein
MAAVPWTRATLVWMLIMLAETGHGAVREFFIAPVIGALRARQLGVFTGAVLVLLITWLCWRALRADSWPKQRAVGIYWVLLTLVFEFSLGRAMGASWNRLLSDYNPAQGGLLLIGLAVMFFAPWWVSRWRKNMRR